MLTWECAFHSRLVTLLHTWLCLQHVMRCLPNITFLCLNANGWMWPYYVIWLVSVSSIVAPHEGGSSPFSLHCHIFCMLYDKKRLLKISRSFQLWPRSQCVKIQRFPTVIHVSEPRCFFLKSTYSMLNNKHLILSPIAFSIFLFSLSISFSPHLTLYQRVSLVCVAETCCIFHLRRSVCVCRHAPKVCVYLRGGPMHFLSVHLCLCFSFDCKCDSPPLQFYRGCISAWRENVCLYNNLFSICHAEAFFLLVYVCVRVCIVCCIQ